jgi:hypothetical protein
VAEIPVGPAASKTQSAASRKPMSVAFSRDGLYLAVTDSRGDIELWKNPLKDAEGLAILRTPAHNTGAAVVFSSQAFFSGGYVVGGFQYGYAAYDPSSLAFRGQGKIPDNQTNSLWATAYAGTYNVDPGTGVITTNYVVVGYNTGVVEVDSVGSGAAKNQAVRVSVFQWQKAPVVGIAFPDSYHYAAAYAGGLAFGKFDPVKGTFVRAYATVASPAGTSLIAMASCSTAAASAAKLPTIDVAVFSDGTIIEYNQENGKVAQTIKNSTK